jgi:GPH family glycoside/pentoside/hexuronide:cation symporter
MRLGSSSALFLFVAAAAAGFVPQYRSLLGGPRDGYSRVAIVFAIATILAILVTFISTKERASMKPKDKSSASPKEMLKVMLGDRHFYMTVAVFFLVNATNVGSFNMIYFVKYYLVDENLIAYLTFAGLIPMAIGMFFAPALAKKLGMRKAFICGICSSVIGSLISWLGGANVIFLALGMAIKAFGYAPAFASILAFIGNVGNYLYWKSGVPVQSVMFSATSASQKLGAGFAAGMAGWLLTLGKYAPNAEVQPESAIFVMRFSVIIWPVIMMLGILVLLLGFGIMKKTEKIDMEIKEGKFANGRTWRDL